MNGNGEDFRLQGRILILGTAPGAVARQLAGEDITLAAAGPLRDNVSTDEITPLPARLNHGQALARDTHTGTQFGDQTPLTKGALEDSTITVLVAGTRHGKGSSREHAPLSDAKLSHQAGPPLGHEVRLMPASYVKPYVKGQKNDATDAEAICEAVARPTMRFVPVKSEEQQSVLMLYRVRELLVRQWTMLVNALRGHLAEFGMVTRQGIAGVGMLIALLEDDDHDLISPLARAALLPLIGQLREVHEKISEMDRQIHAWHRSSELSRRLETIPGIGRITASAIAATVGKERLGRIIKQGDPYLRRLLVVGAHAVLRFRRKGKAAPTHWAAELLAKKPYNVGANALANKMARIVWALMTSGRHFETSAAA